MKRLICIILTLSLVFSLVACNGDSSNINDDNNSDIVDNSDNKDNENGEDNNESDNTDNSGDSQTGDSQTGDNSEEVIDNSDLSADELFKQASSFYRDLDNFQITQSIYSCIINYSDLTAEPVLYPTLNKVTSQVFNTPFSFISHVNYNYFDGKDNNTLDGIVENNIEIDQYGKLVEDRNITVYEKFSNMWNNITVSQEDFVKNDNIGSKYIMNYGYYFRNGAITGETNYDGKDVIVAEYDLTDEFAMQLFANYGFQNFVKSNDAEGMKEEILSAMEESKLTVYFDKTSAKIVLMQIDNAGMPAHLRKIVAVDHIEELSEETYVQLLTSFEKLKIYSQLIFGEVNQDITFEVPKEALK